MSDRSVKLQLKIENRRLKLELTECNAKIKRLQRRLENSLYALSGATMRIKAEAREREKRIHKICTCGASLGVSNG